MTQIEKSSNPTGGREGGAMKAASYTPIGSDVELKYCKKNPLGSGSGNRTSTVPNSLYCRQQKVNEFPAKWQNRSINTSWANTRLCERCHNSDGKTYFTQPKFYHLAGQTLHNDGIPSAECEYVMRPS